MSSKNIFYRQWLKKAGEDELSAKALSKVGSPATVCFLSQQATEKLLKTLLVFYEKEFPKVHDLTVLAQLLKPVIPQIENFKEDLKSLSTYYVETRYPGDYPELTWKDATAALKAMEKIKKFVLAKIDTSREN